MQDLPAVDDRGQKTLIDSAQDDDLESDDDVVRAGVETSFKDLLVVKDRLRMPAEKVRSSLKTFRIWAPNFRGKLPMLSEHGKAGVKRTRSHFPLGVRNGMNLR